MDKTDEAAGSAIAAFTLAQLGFWHLVQSGSLPAQKAVEMLKQGVESNSKGGPANQVAANLLQTVLDMIAKNQKPTN